LRRGFFYSNIADDIREKLAAEEGRVLQMEKHVDPVRRQRVGIGWRGEN